MGLGKTFKLTYSYTCMLKEPEADLIRLERENEAKILRRIEMNDIIDLRQAY